MTEPKQKAILNRIVWRSRLKLLLQLCGILLICIGVMFVLPSGYGGPEAKTTIFNRIVNLGGFGKPGTILIAVGAIALVASWLIPGDLYEDP